MPKLIRITTAPISLKSLLKGQMGYMQKNGFEVIMISSEGKEWEEVIAVEKCRHQIIQMTRSITPFKDLRALWVLYKFIKKENPDIVHSHTPKAGLLAMLAAKFAGVKIRVHTIAGLRFMTAKGFTRKLLVSMEKLTAKAATHVWPNSFSLQQYIIDNRLVRKEKLEVIGLGSSNGINLLRFSNTALSPEKVTAIKLSIKYDSKLIYFLCVGRIVHDKGIDELVNAFVKVSKKNTAVRLIVAGVFEDEVDPVSDITKNILKTNPAIIMAGWSDEVEYYMQFSYALVHASHREGFPNVLLQAGAMLCPIICSRIEGNIDIVKDEETGLLFDVGNENHLQAQMENAIINPAPIKKYAATLRSRIEQHFDQAVLHALLLKKYEELLD